MTSIRSTFIIVFALALAVPGARAQYIWSVKHSDQIVSVLYTMTAIDCYGSTCTVAAQKLDYSNNDRLTLTFFRSDDNGETWVEQDPGLPPLRGSLERVVAFQQIDSFEWRVAVGGNIDGVGDGDSAIILRTFDGGITWQRQSIDSSIYEVSSVSFSDSSHGIVTHGRLGSKYRLRPMRASIGTMWPPLF